MPGAAVVRDQLLSARSGHAGECKARDGERLAGRQGRRRLLPTGTGPPRSGACRVFWPAKDRSDEGAARRPLSWSVDIRCRICPGLERPAQMERCGLREPERDLAVRTVDRPHEDLDRIAQP